MPFKKGNPRPPNAGRNKGTKNKPRTARERAEAVIAAGIRPGDSYDEMWFQVLRMQQFIDQEEEMASPDQKLLIELYSEKGRYLEKLLPFERARLAPIDPQGDGDNPPRIRPDLSKLTVDELKFLERIILKAGGGHTSGAGRDEHERRDLQAPGKVAGRG